MPCTCTVRTETTSPPSAATAVVANTEDGGCPAEISSALAAQRRGDPLEECGLPLPTLSLLLRANFASERKLSQLTDIRSLGSLHQKIIDLLPCLY